MNLSCSIKLFLLVVLVSFTTDTAFAARLIDRAGNDTLMVVIVSKKGAEDYLEYAENTLKERLRGSGFRVMNPEMTEKVKKDRILFEAIKNASASAMARISTDYGAGILVRGTLVSVGSTERISGNWDGTAAISLVAIDTKTGEEIEVVANDPMGTTGNPAPMEESPLGANQMAIRGALDNLLQKLGAGAEVITGQVAMNVRFSSLFKSSVGKVNALLFSHDSDTIFIGGNDGVAVCRQGCSEAKVLSDEIPGKVTNLALSRDGAILAVATTKGNIHLLELPGGKKKGAIDAHSSGAWALDFSPDGKVLASGGGNGIIRFWDVGSAFKLGEIRGHSDKVTSIAFDLRGRTIVSISEDLTIKTWDVSTRKEVRAFSESMDRLTSSTFSADKGLMAYSAKTVDFDLRQNKRIDKRFIRVRDCLTGRDIATFEGHSKDINALSFVSGKRFLISSAEDRQARVWDIEKRTEIANLELSSKESRLAATRDGRLIVTSDDNRVTVWTTR